MREVMLTPKLTLENRGTSNPMDVPIMQGWVILDRLVDVILHHRPGCVVEIGAGISTGILAKHAQAAGVKMYSCDIFPKVEKIYDEHFIYLGYSVQFMEWFLDKKDKPSVVLLDGSHNKEMVKLEFDFFSELLVEGGVIFIHDTYPPHETFLHESACSDAYKLRQELEQETENFDCFTWPYTALDCGLTMVIKKEKVRPYWGQ